MGPARPHPRWKTRCMDPQHLARLDDDGTVRRSSTGTAGGSSATTAPEGLEAPVAAPVHPPDPAAERRAGGSLVRRTRGGGATIVLRPDGPFDDWPLPVHQDEPSGDLA